MKLIKYILYSMDVTTSEPILREVSGSEEGIMEYAGFVVSEITKPLKGQTVPKGQKFQFNSMTERISSALLRILKDDKWDIETKDIAYKLHEVEIDTQEQIKHMTQMRKGGLLQIQALVEGETKFIIVKVDDTRYLDDIDLKIKSGLPFDTRVQKAAVITFDHQYNVTELLVSDTNSTISKYWWKDFLVASPLQDAKTNTKNAFDAIDKLLNTSIKTVSKADYWLIRNDLIISFRQEAFVFNEFVDRLEKYQPVSEECSKIFSKFIDEFRKLPTKNPNKTFDTQFELDSTAITARMVNKIILDENFELKINGDIKDLKTKLSADIDGKGKYIKIYSDQGYNQFQAFGNE